MPQRVPNYNITAPKDMKIKKELILYGHDLHGDNIASIAVGTCTNAPYWGICVVGVNNQRKSIVFDNEEDLDMLIKQLQHFKATADFDAMRWRQAVR